MCINDYDHDYKKLSGGHLVKGEVVIGKNVWIGANEVILRNIFIGDNALIGEGSIVKGNVPANSALLNKRSKDIFEYEYKKTVI